jgi:hypothetical protein
LQHRVAGEEDLVVADEQRGEIDEEADGGADAERRRVAPHRPSSPAGRAANVSSSKPKDTAGAQEGP